MQASHTTKYKTCYSFLGTPVRKSNHFWALTIRASLTSSVSGLVRTFGPEGSFHLVHKLQSSAVIGRFLLALAEGPFGPKAKMVLDGVHGRALWALQQKW